VTAQWGVTCGAGAVFATRFCKTHDRPAAFFGGAGGGFACHSIASTRENAKGVTPSAVARLLPLGFHSDNFS